MKILSRRQFLKTSIAAGALLSAGHALPRPAYPALQTLPMPRMRSTSGNAVLNALQKRASSREFSPDAVPLPVLAQLLWAAFGVNRLDGKRTAPSAQNKQEIDIYVALPYGLYLYDAKGSLLTLIDDKDLRGLTGEQPFVKLAPVNLIYVADAAKMGEMPQEQRLLWMGADTGVIAENVYLFCAAEGLATVLRAKIDKPALAGAMKLRPEQVITLSQSVGYPKKT